MPGIYDLSEREREILRLVATGASNKEIAQQLFISTNTVKVHLRNIFAKIGVASRTEAAMVAVNAGLVEKSASQAAQSAASQPEAGGQVRENFPATPAVMVVETPPIAPALPASATRRSGWGAALLFSAILLGVVGLALAFMRQPVVRTVASPPTATVSPRWRTMASMPTARSSLALVTYEGQIYAIGGRTAQGVRGTVERFTPASNQWSRGADKPTPVQEISAAAVGGKIYVPGGRLANGQATNLLEIYDPRQDQWEDGIPLPQALSAYALAAFEGKLYLFGGWDGQRPVRSVYEFDPELNSWNEKTELPSARAFPGIAVSGNKIFLIGGYDGKNALADNDIYQPDQDNGKGNPWGHGAPLPKGLYGMGAGSLADIIYIVGGKGDSPAASDVLGYLPQDDKWEKLDSTILNAWTDLSLAPLGSRLYVLGGNLDGTPTTQNLAYQVIYTVLFPVVK